MENLEATYYRWAYALLIELAKVELATANANREATDEWPCGMEWDELNGSSKSIFLTKARDRASINHDEFLEPIRRGEIGVTDLYES